MYVVTNNTERLLNWKNSNTEQGEIETIMKNRTSDDIDYNYVDEVEKIQITNVPYTEKVGKG